MHREGWSKESLQNVSGEEKESIRMNKRVQSI